MKDLQKLLPSEAKREIFRFILQRMKAAEINIYHEPIYTMETARKELTEEFNLDVSLFSGNKWATDTFMQQFEHARKEYDKTVVSVDADGKSYRVIDGVRKYQSSFPPPPIHKCQICKDTGTDPRRFPLAGCKCQD